MTTTTLDPIMSAVADADAIYTVAAPTVCDGDHDRLRAFYRSLRKIVEATHG